eukprot:TRINITY_DN68172_c6_g5_i1.p1 TRINITY_DN68172_c6_g5~~TRINITY_DN68172_c6_g5_i1.p1  ORF type:complete len:106 (-),score=3.43 TRINITY_DN68172_c6_g5_i1:936-1253(-)
MCSGFLEEESPQNPVHIMFTAVYMQTTTRFDLLKQNLFCFVLWCKLCISAFLWDLVAVLLRLPGGKGRRRTVGVKQTICVSIRKTGCSTLNIIKLSIFHLLDFLP